MQLITPVLYLVIDAWNDIFECYIIYSDSCFDC